MEANWHGRLRLVIQFIYSKTKMLTSIVQTWTDKIEQETADLKNLK